VGRPRKRPDLLIADRGYSYPSSRRLLRSRKIPHMIPERSDQRERRFGRPPVFDADVYFGIRVNLALLPTTITPSYEV